MSDTVSGNAVPSETIDLWGWSDTYESDSMDQRIFGHLVRLAAPIVKEYHSDLFHDAEWVRDNINGPMSFLFCVRHSGTHIGDVSAQYGFDSQEYDAALYKISLSVDERGRWTLRIYLMGERPTRP